MVQANVKGRPLLAVDFVDQRSVIDEQQQDLEAHVRGTKVGAIVESSSAESVSHLDEPLAHAAPLLVRLQEQANYLNTVLFASEAGVI